MQLARRGGHLTGEKIRPEDADGHVQALILYLLSKDLDVPHLPRRGEKWEKAAGGDLSRPLFGEELAIPPIIDSGTIDTLPYLC